MTEQVPGYVVALIFFMIVVTIAMFGAFVAGFLIFLWSAFRSQNQDGEEGEDDGWGGGGGWTDKPSGKPPGGGGPDRDIDKQFHILADAVGKTIEIEKKEQEKVLT